MEIRTLDELWDEHIRSTSVLLKTDTQGFDLKVIEGADAHLQYVKAISIEVSLNPIYEHAPDFDATRAFLEARNYYLSNLAHVYRGKECRLVEMDALFLREPTA